MTIAVNTRFLLTDYLEGYGYFISETFGRISKSHPEHNFIFIFDRPFDDRFIYGQNITPVVAGPPARHPLLWKWWYDVRIPSVLKKYKAEVFVSCDGFCSLTSRVPQCLVVHDLSFLHYPQFHKRSHLFYYKKYTPRFLKKASSLATVSAFSKKDILAHYPDIGPPAIDVVFSAAKSCFQPVSETIKEQTKQQYTGGKEFFLYSGAIHPRKNLINLLKAFSLFKKRMQSNMKLVLAGRLAWKYESFLNDLNTYKYREEVVLTHYLPENELARLTASAYALVYPSLYEGFGVPVLEAMQCQVPVLTSARTAMQEIAKDAALYAEATRFEDIADKMMRLYNDETLRNELIQKGQQVASRYSWDKTAELLWQTIQRAIG
jgi:glycosyltransferase involved in cell wall biosynthesis